MRHNLPKHLFFVLLFILFVFSSPALSGQTGQPDTQTENEETVNIIDISNQSSEAILESRQIKERMIKLKKLLQKKKEIDSIVNQIHIKLKKERKADFSEADIRKIESQLISLQQDKSLIYHKNKNLNALLTNLVANKKFLTTRLNYWKKVKQIVLKKKMGGTIKNSVNEAISTITQTLFTINRLINITMGMQRSFSALELEIDTRIDILDKAKHKRQKELLSSLKPSLFALDYSNKANKSLIDAFTNLYEVEFVNLKNYLNIHLNNLIFHIIIFIVLITVFIRLSKTQIPLEIGEGLPYKKRLKKLLSRPISTALIIGAFSSTILYTNSPLVFKDILLLLLIIPMTILLKAIFDKKFRVYIYALALISFSMIVYSYFPPNNVYTRFLLLFIGFTELFTVIHFIYSYNSRISASAKAKRFILFLGYGILIVIIIGITGNILGKVMLSRYLLFSFSKILIVLFLVLVTTIMINGIVVIFITSNLAEKSNVIRKNKHTLIKKIPRFFNFIALLILFHYFLKILGWEETVLSSLDTWLSHEYKIGSIVFSWGKLFVFIIIIWFSIILSRIVRDVLEEDILNKVRMDEGLPHTIATMARYSLITIGVLLAFSALGMPMSDLAIMFSAFGVGIGFGLQNIFNNLVSGFILLFERPIKIGDTIEVGELVGTVRSIGIRASNIRTFDGAEIIVPNGNLISNEVVNWTLSDQRRRIEIMVNVSYNTDPQKVKQVLLDLLNQHEDVAKDPKPGIYFVDMGNSALVFRILFWTHQYGKWYSTRSNLMYDIFQALNEAGIEIPYDQMDIHIRSTEVENIIPK